MISSLTGRRTEGGTSPRVNVVAIAVLVAALLIGVAGLVAIGNPIPLIAMALVGVIGMQAPQVAQQWERAIVLRLGRFVALRGPGLFWLVPFIDRVSAWIGQRAITTS